MSCITAWLKYYYPNEYFTAVLSLLDTGNKDKLKKQLKSYIKLLDEVYNIKVLPPDINKSDEMFTSLPDENKILFGLSSINGVGEKPIQAIIKNRPYNTLEEFYERVTKTNVNKTAGKALIKAGAFDELYKDTGSNRYALLNRFYTIRKDKDDRYNEEEYNKSSCISLEKESISISLTHKEWIDQLCVGDIINITCNIKSITTKFDKNERLMAFITVEKDGCEMDVTVFANDYMDRLCDLYEGNTVNIDCEVSIFNDALRLTLVNNKRKKRRRKAS